MDTFLKLWAIVGPLLVGAASAIWSQRIRTSDRAFEQAKDNLDRTHAANESLRTYRRVHGAEMRSEQKAALTAFIATMHDYAIHAARARTDAAAQQQFVDSIAALNQTYARVVLIADRATSEAAEQVTTAAVRLPASSSANGEFDAESVATFRTARTAFVQCARQCLEAQKEV